MSEVPNPSPHEYFNHAAAAGSLIGCAYSAGQLYQTLTDDKQSSSDILLHIAAELALLTVCTSVLLAIVGPRWNMFIRSSTVVIVSAGGISVLCFCASCVIRNLDSDNGAAQQNEPGKRDQKTAIESDKTRADPKIGVDWVKQSNIQRDVLEVAAVLGQPYHKQAALQPSQSALKSGSLWQFSEQTMQLVLDGHTKMQISYVMPRPGMRAEGVRSGTILFDGKRNKHGKIKAPHTVFQRHAVQSPIM